MDGRDEAGGAEYALARLNERPANASVKLVIWTSTWLRRQSVASNRVPPPSLHELPLALRQLFVHAMPGECGGAGGDAVCPSQSTQSLSYAHFGTSKANSQASTVQSDGRGGELTPRKS